MLKSLDRETKNLKKQGNMTPLKDLNSLKTKSTIEMVKVRQISQKYMSKK